MTLQLRDDGTFSLVQLTDLHWKNGEATDLATRRTIETVLDAERPDLVVLTGDILAGGGCKDPARGLHEVLAPIVERGLSWAGVFGNHDDEGSLDRRALLDVMMRIPGCLSRPGPEDVPGVGNFHLEIAGPNGKLAWTLYFLDSNAYAKPPLEGYAWVDAGQIAHLKATASSLTARHGPRPALAFFHIPTPEWDEVWRTQVCYGVKHERVCAPPLNSGLFAAMVDIGDVLGAFVGHDHVNDYIGTLHGVALGYGRATGHSTYGREGMPRGARVFRLHPSKRHFDTWLRLETGERVDPQPAHQPEG